MFGSVIMEQKDRKEGDVQDVWEEFHALMCICAAEASTHALMWTEALFSPLLDQVLISIPRHLLFLLRFSSLCGVENTRHTDWLYWTGPLLMSGTEYSIVMATGEHIMLP